jgi:hypothetical protein
MKPATMPTISGKWSRIACAYSPPTSPKYCGDRVTLWRISSRWPTNRFTFATAPPVSEPEGTTASSAFA